jgi:hypothetical protein
MGDERQQDAGKKKGESKGSHGKPPENWWVAELAAEVNSFGRGKCLQGASIQTIFNAVRSSADSLEKIPPVHLGAVHGAEALDRKSNLLKAGQPTMAERVRVR